MRIRTEEELINELKIECEKENRMLTCREIDKNPNLANSTTYRKRLGNMDKLAELINFTDKRVRAEKTNKQLLNELKIECEKESRMLTYSEIANNKNLSSYPTYNTRFGGLKEVANLIGFEYLGDNYIVDKKYSDEELLNTLLIECKKKKRMLTNREINANSSLASGETYNLRFGGLENVAKLIGFKYLGNDYNVSVWEIEVREYIESIISKDIIYNDRIILYGRELDIYIPKLNIAIECNGIYWHSINMKNEKYHLAKTEDCLLKGITLIHIWDYEWETNNKEIKEYLSNIIKGYSIKAIPKTKDSNIIIDDRMKPILYNNVKIYEYTKPEIIIIDGFECWNCGNSIYKLKDKIMPL